MARPVALAATHPQHRQLADEITKDDCTVAGHGYPCTLYTRLPQSMRDIGPDDLSIQEAPGFIGAPYGIRTRVTAVKGRCPRPLDEGRTALPKRLSDKQSTNDNRSGV